MPRTSAQGFRPCHHEARLVRPPLLWKRPGEAGRPQWQVRTHLPNAVHSARPRSLAPATHESGQVVRTAAFAEGTLVIVDGSEIERILNSEGVHSHVGDQ